MQIVEVFSASKKDQQTTKGAHRFQNCEENLKLNISGHRLRIPWGRGESDSSHQEFINASPSPDVEGI